MVDQPCLGSKDGERDLGKCLEHSKQALLVGLIRTKLIHHDGPQVEIAGVQMDTVVCHCLQGVGRVGREMGGGGGSGEGVRRDGRGRRERGGGVNVQMFRILQMDCSCRYGNDTNV